MPWRLRPRAAPIVVLSASALIAASAGLRAPASAPLSSIDATLTRDAAGCAGVSSIVWHPLSGLDYTGRLRITLPARFGGAIAIYVGDRIPLDLEASTQDDQPLAMNHERLIAGPGALLPPDFWLEDGTPLDAPRHVSRVVLDASGEDVRIITLSLGRRAARVLARLVNYPSNVRAPVCAQQIADGEVYYATGWSGQATDPLEGSIRWMGEHGAIVVSSPDGGAAQLRVRVAPAVSSVGDERTRLTVRVNDVMELAPVSLSAGFADYEFAVPDAAWVRGANELLFSVSRTDESGRFTRGLALASLHVR